MNSFFEGFFSVDEISWDYLQVELYPFLFTYNVQF